jgi:signal transduction histidine kinase
MSSGWVTGRAEAVWDWWRGYDPAVWDRWLAVAFLGLAFVPALSSVSAELGDRHGGRPEALAVVLILGQTVPLVARSRRPGLCLAVIGVSFAAYEALGYPAQFGDVTIYIALYSAGAHLSRFRRGAALAASAGYVALTVVLLGLGSPDALVSFAIFYLALAGCWILGAFVRQRQRDEDTRRRLAAVTAIAAERARIARELHDVVTHHVTAMVVQAGAAQYAAEAPEPAVAALTNIGDTGRAALAELRQLLDVLNSGAGSAPDTQPPDTQAYDTRASGTAVPGVAAVRDLVERTRTGGQPIDLIEDGDQGALPAAVGLAVYRVVQEGLTNAVKYAAGRPTVVQVGRRDGRVEVEVANEASPVPLSADARRALSGGRGLAGLRDRVGALGGELTAGPQPDGRFLLRAVIPAADGGHGGLTRTGDRSVSGGD